MEDRVFGKDLEARFREHSPTAFDFHATHDGTNFKELAEEHGSRLVALMTDPTSHPDQVFSFGRHMHHVAVAVEQRVDPNGYWIIGGGPKSELARDVLRAQFDSLAVLAAVVGRVVEHYGHARHHRTLALADICATDRKP